MRKKISQIRLSEILGVKLPILVGKEAVDVGLINEIGGIADAFGKLKDLIFNDKSSKM